MSALLNTVLLLQEASIRSRRSPLPV